MRLDNFSNRAAKIRERFAELDTGSWIKCRGCKKLLELIYHSEMKSVQLIQDQLDQLSFHRKSPVPQAFQDSSPDTPQLGYDLKQGWLNGVFGCLRPVLSIIGKGAVTDVRNIRDDFDIPFHKITWSYVLGSGGQGTVFKGTLNNLEVAVKQIPELKEVDIKNMKKLDHHNVVKFKGVCTQGPFCCIVMEYCPNGTLFDFLRERKNIVTTKIIVTWAEEIASGMHYLHSHKIIHRDLKSPNVLIGDGYKTKISDFGTSRTWNGVSEKMTFAGTVAWMAPEAIRELACSEKVDVWSFGIVIWELLTRQIPYDGMEQSAIMYSVGMGKLKLPIPATCPTGFKLIMEMCWKVNPKNRPSFKLICTHLAIASVEILAYKEDQFLETQESWKTEIKSQVSQFKTELQKYRIQLKLKEEELIEKRENEIKRIKDIKEYYKCRTDKVEQMYVELKNVVQAYQLIYLQQGRQGQCGGRKRENQNKRRLINPFRKKIERKRSNHSSTPTSPEHSLTSPDSPQIVSPSKSPLYAQLNTSTESVTQTTTTQNQSFSKYRKRHQRSNSGSPRNSKSSSVRSSVVVDAGTQTDSPALDATDSITTSRSSCKSIRIPQRVVLHELRDGTDDEGNCVQLRYVQQDYGEESDAVQIFTRMENRTMSSSSPHDNMFDDHDDAINDNTQTQYDYSDEDNLETISRKVMALTNGNIFNDMLMSVENGNIQLTSDTSGENNRKTSETVENLGGDGAGIRQDDYNDDSFTDEEGEVYEHSLRRRSQTGKDPTKLSFARRPIYPGRRSRFKGSSNYYHKKMNVSDEGNTSEYSVSPSSKSSTLESNPDTIRKAMKRPSEQRSYSSSDTEENVTVFFNMNKPENVI